MGDQTQQIQKYENKIKELLKQNKIYRDRLENNNNPNVTYSDNASSEIQKLKQEIERLHEQLFEGSNIRRELREFVAKYQREGQLKLNKNYKKLTFMKHLVFETFKVLNQERHYVDNNNSLRQHLEFLRSRLQENQENNQPNFAVK